jgi:type III pantothenate kinase
MANLIIDAGNTRVKLFVFKADKVLEHLICDENQIHQTMKNLFKNYVFENTIVSCVGGMLAKIQKELEGFSNLLVLSSETKVPFKNHYRTPETLGVDRLALVSAAAVQFPNKNVLVVDAGTCVTYDILSEKGIYFGGAISLGLRMRLKALHVFTENLPEVEISSKEMTVGDDTESSIQVGVKKGFLYEIEGMLAAYKKQFDDLTIVLTGGDAEYLSKRLKNSIFAQPNFLAEGLQAILIHNTHQ